MPLWTCSVDKCGRAAVRRHGDCPLCNRHLCRLHLGPEWHDCPDPDKDWPAYCKRSQATEAQLMDALIASVDQGALCQRATALRSGVPCSVDMSRKTLQAKMGGQNCHTQLVFDDGVRWIVRFRLGNVTAPPAPVRDYILRSEAATLEYLSTKTTVPCPKIHDWGCERDGENKIGAGYIIMEMLDRQAYNMADATEAQRRKGHEQLADVFIELQRHSFPKSGSLIGRRLTSSQVEYHVDAFARQSFCTAGDGKPQGPYSSPAEQISDLVLEHMKLVESGELGATEDDALDLWLAHCLRREVLRSGKLHLPSSAKFCLKHADKGDHILVDKDYNIKGIIDWEWASTAHEEYALTTPMALWPVGPFYDGSNELSADEKELAEILSDKGHKQLAALMLGGRPLQRLLFDLQGGSLLRHDDFVSLFGGLATAIKAEITDRASWKEHALQAYKDEPFIAEHVARMARCG